MRRVKTKTVHLFSGGRDQGEDWSSEKEPQIIIILLFCVSADEIKGWDKGEGRGNKTVELVSPY
jgi:hypothetical protein